ncbi:neural-cadherin-like [Aphidius gifuensis]|uniref:neural-cadherin-like n=1 Tax=Aphidius gifuensis TaxID=684658 RepID=UPI001CDC55DA|nr:neural-cadherin-like [Aphidius gifuensis]
MMKMWCKRSVLLVSLMMIIWNTSATTTTTENKIELRWSESLDDKLGQTKFSIKTNDSMTNFMMKQHNQWFSVNSNGDLILKKKLDYKKLENDKTIHFPVLYKNKTTSRYEDLHVIIKIYNIDERPYFVNHAESMKTILPPMALTQPNYKVYKFKAIDPESNSPVFYKTEKLSGASFIVNETTGEVRVNGNQDFTINDEYFVTVQATVYDKKINRTLSSNEHKLSIIIGNRSPQFQYDKYDIEIMENQVKDKTIIKINATSFTSISSIKYELKTKNSKSDGFFTINEKSGEVKLVKDLDYEDPHQPKEHNLQVIANEVYHSDIEPSSVDLTISVIDINDNYPIFEIPDYQIRNIDEDIPIDTSILQVIVKDADSNENGIIEYSVTDDNFRIDNAGVIYNNKKLDADYNKALYKFEVIASNPIDITKKTSAIVRISTNNKNDEIPQFTKDNFISSIDENAQANTFVTTIIASDIDNDIVKYSFDNDRLTSGPFEINADTGIIRLRSNHKSFDKDMYELTVTASDDGSCCIDGKSKIHKNTTQVIVSITDINDNKPVFDNCTMYSPSVKESQPIGTSVITVTATDKDIGINKIIKYKIISSGDKFKINEDTGEITTNAELDREEFKTIPITVRAIDCGKYPLEGFCSFKINIIDINDNPPIFTKTKYEFFINNDIKINSTIGRVTATDADADENSRISYFKLSETNDWKYFDLNTKTGSIILKKLPVFGKKNYKIDIYASDNGTPVLNSTVVEVAIRITNVKKSLPIWIPSEYEPFHVKENHGVNTIVMTMKAVSGMASSHRLTFEILSGKTPETNGLHTFKINKRDKLGDDNSTFIDIILNNQLHCELVPNYTLTIEATNDDELRSLAIITMIVDDTNDQEPAFGIRSDKETILENKPIGTFVFKPEITDKDVVYPYNSVTYKIIKQDNPFFTINEKTGEVYTNKVFDHEDNTIQKLQFIEILATDGANSTKPNAQGPNTAHKEFRILIIDANDNLPSFNQTLYTGQVEENSDRMTKVLQVFASDPDELDVLQYEIIDGNTRGEFLIDRETGEIFVFGTIDYETKTKYNLTIRATDSSNNCVSTVLIDVIDKNDNIPVFDKSNYIAYITEEDDKNLPKFVLNVSSIDGDKGRPQKHRYSINHNKFKIVQIDEKTGALYILEKLDRDPPHGQPQLHFTVYAHDEDGPDGSIGVADITINVKDINDNFPYFSKSIYDAQVKENGTKGLNVMMISAADDDDPLEGDNAKLTYSISKNERDPKSGADIFEIEPTSGQIKTAICCLDYEEKRDYSIQVIAEDGGKHQATATVSIRIIDVNDMPPRFTNETWYVSVSETDTVNLPKSSILTVTVEDEDEKESNLFEYKIIENNPGNGADRFSIETNKDGSGSLKIKKYLDYENEIHKKGFKFLIQVSDKGTNDDDKYHVAYSWVNITLIDKNDNKPHFENPITSVDVSEDKKIGTIIGEKFTATDPDNDGKNNITYFIERRSNFHIDNNGIVTIKKMLDREKESIHYVAILAIDNGVPALTATTTLTVTVTDVNDNAPRLRENTAMLKENSPPTNNIITLTAIDDDDKTKGNGPPFIIGLDINASDEIKNNFDVKYENKDDGIAIVSSLKILDREFKKEYYIPIVIKDNGKPTMTGTSTLTVIIGDTNDNPMSYGSKNILVYQYDDKPIDTDIGKVYVNDLDDWDTDKTFKFEDELDHSPFSLTETTGMIRMKLEKPLSNYGLNFEVKDYQTSVTAHVTIDVKKITHEAIINSGSMRISGVSYDDFIKINNQGKSKLNLFIEKLSVLLNVDPNYIDVFSVQQQQKNPSQTDIRYSVKNPLDITHEKLTNSKHEHGVIYYQPVKLNGIVSMHREEIERDVGINILMVGIDECLTENNYCGGSCTNRLDIRGTPYVVDMNSTSLVGVYVKVTAECTCAAKTLNNENTCETMHCYNGAKCIETKYGAKCECAAGYDGPRCQLTTRSFKGKGWAWYPSFEMCENNHLSFEFITNNSTGQLLYTGPIGPPKLNSPETSHFISIELINGLPKLLINFGTEIIELSIKNNNQNLLNDGEWHRLDVTWNLYNIELIVDMCKNDKSSCYETAPVPLSNDYYLSINGPVQIGGLNIASNTIEQHKWKKSPKGIGFDGCIKNIIYNSKIYDLGLPGFSKESWPGCSQVDDICNKHYLNKCWEHGICVGTFTKPKCQCDIGWSGTYCNEKTIQSTFNEKSYIKYELLFEPDSYSTNVQFNFRTRQLNGELFRINDKRKFKYAVIEIIESHLLFRFNLNDKSIDEHKIWLSDVKVNDGQWHTVKVSRYGSACMIELDGGEGIRSNETIIFKGQQNFIIDKNDGVYVGGVEPSGTYEAYGDFQHGCMSDVRLDDRHLPLPPTLMKTSAANIASFKNVVSQCYDDDNKQCQPHIYCKEPYQCVDTWNNNVCTCGIGKQLSSNNTMCTDKNECLYHPCLNDGQCINQDSPMIYQCHCINNFMGHNCELVEIPNTSLLIVFSYMPVTIIVLCIILFILLLYIVKIKRREKPMMDTEMKELPRDKLLPYESEGGGEEDTDKFDKGILLNAKYNPLPTKESDQPVTSSCNNEPLPPGVSDFIDDRMTNTGALLAPDNTTKYAYEGDGNSMGSLSSLSTEGEPDELSNILPNEPKFRELADILEQIDDDDDDDNDDDDGGGGGGQISHSVYV